MSRFNDFFDVAPKAGHVERVMEKAQGELARNQAARSANTRRHFFSFLGLSAAGLAGLLIWSRNSDQSRERDASAMLAFADVEPTDWDLLTQNEDEDFLDLLDNLDELEELNELEENV